MAYRQTWRHAPNWLDFSFEINDNYTVTYNGWGRRTVGLNVCACQAIIDAYTYVYVFSTTPQALAGLTRPDRPTLVCVCVCVCITHPSL